MSEGNKLVPKLRFPEFQDTGEWEEGKLGDKEISEFVKDRIPLDQLDVGSYISTVNLLPDFAGIKTATKLPPSGSFTQFRKKDVLISNIRPYLKKVWQAQMDGSASNDLIVIRATNKIIDNFLMYILKNGDFINYVMKDAKGVKMPRGDISSIKKYPLYYPSGKEQQKIADCLSSIDELIIAHTQKHESLKAHKKGLMQQLFPSPFDSAQGMGRGSLSEVEMIPKLRFPEFRDAGGWEEIKFIDVADKKIKWSFIGGPFGSNLKSSDYVTEGIRIIQLQNIGDAEFKGDYKIFTSENKANELLSNNIYPGEIILSKMGDPVGRACLIPSTHPRYVMCSDGIRLVVDEELFSQYFIYTLINFDHFRNLIAKTATGSTRKRIGLADLKKLPMIVPKLKEQQEIAGCLSTIDDLITTQAKKIDSLKAHKKGLMQQLFPATDEEGA